MGILLLAISAALLAATCRAAARRVGETPAERFWVGVAAAGLQLGTIAAALSLLRAVTPVAWVAAQVVLLIATMLVVRRVSPAPSARGGLLGEAFATPTTKLVGVAILAVVLLAMAEQFALPVREFDDRMYHGSRAAYWLQHRSVFGYATHNERQVAFPFGGELWFFWPLLMTRSENAAQLGFGLALPLCAIGAYWTLREAGAWRNGAALGAAAFMFAPMVLYHTRGLRPELWAALYATGCAFWALRAMRDETGRRAPFALAGVCFALAVNVKATTLPMALGLIVLPWLARPGKLRAAAAVTVGVIVGAVLSGLVATAAYNWREHRHLLGSRELRDVHRADVSRAQVRTHATRFALALIDPPVATAAIRDALDDGGEWFLTALRADAPLPREEQPWPGPYAYRVPTFAGNYSLAGVAWVALLAVALVGVAWDLARTWPHVRLAPSSVLALFAAPPLLAAVLLIRWAPGAPRFWVPAYALGVLVFVPMIERLASRRRWVGAACAVALLGMAFPATWFHVSWSLRNLAAEYSPVALEEPFFEPLAHVDDGSTILLVATQDARDYPLFAPRRGFPNRVVPWGAGPFDAQRMRRLIDDRGVTHVLVQADPQPDWSGGPVRDVSPMVNWLTRQPDLREISLPYTPGVRLFARTAANGPAATSPIR